MLHSPLHPATSRMVLWYVSASVQMSLKSGQWAVFICWRVLGDGGVFVRSAVSPPPYVRSSRSVGRLSAFAVDVRLCAPLQVTVGDHLLPCVRSARSRSLLRPEFSNTRSSQAYMCTRSARRAARHWFSCGWRNMLKLSHPECKHMVPHATSSTFQGKSFQYCMKSIQFIPNAALCYNTSACLKWLICPLWTPPDLFLKF